MTRPGAHCVATITGRVVDLAAPTPDMIDIEDIAHALSMLCRYTGHVEYHYSVAQHSVLVHDLLADPALRHAADLHYEWEAVSAEPRWPLLHDAHEAYTGDLSRPFKRMLGGSIVRVEIMLDMAIMAAFRIGADRPGATKTADFVAYCWERRDVAHVPGIWDVPADLVLPAQIIRPWSAAQAKAEFLERFGRYR